MVRVCMLNDATRIFVHTHDDDRIDAMLNLVVRTISPICRCQAILQYRVQERYMRQRHLQWTSAQRLRTINFSLL